MRRGLLLAGMLVLAWLVAVRGYADYLAHASPARALDLYARQPEALVDAAERALIEHRLDEAASAATLAAGRQPLEGRAIRVLGAVAELRGDRTHALALMQLAAATTPRDVSAQFWLAINALADQDIDGALRRLDRLLRFEPKVENDVFPILKTIAVNAVAVQSLAQYLVPEPPWRGEFMGRLVPGVAPAELSRLFRAIEKHGGRVTDVELDMYAARLATLQDWPRLRVLLRRMAANDVEPVHDGGFAGTGRGPFLGWSIEKTLGVDARMGADASANSALHLAFYDRRVPFQHVWQVLLLEPGEYRLSGRVRLVDLETARGLNWTLTCAASGLAIGKSERMRGSSDWRPFELSFVVPANDCGGQVLRLVLDARIAAEQQIAGQAWFDDLAIRADADKQNAAQRAGSLP